MADIATLGIKIDSSQVSSLTSSLNKATSSTESLTKALQQMNNMLKNLPNNTPSITNQTNALDKMLSSLSEQEKKLAMTRREYVQYNMSLLGATDAQKKLADTIVKNIEAIKAKDKANRDALATEKQRVGSIQSLIAGLNNQVNTIGKTKAEITDYKLKLLGASDAERAHAKALAEKVQKLEESNNKTNNSKIALMAMAGAAGAAAAVVYSIAKGLKSFGESVLETAKIADNFKYSLLAVSDSSEQAAETYKYLEKEANRLGQSITGNVDAFTGFMAAAKAANMTTEQAKKAYTGLNEAMTALHRTPEQASQALYALQQMLSTGTVRAQELNIQLGNAIPGAVPMFAQALGKTTSELRDMMQKGLVPANESVVKFTDYLSNKFAPSAEAAADSVQGNLNKMDNAVYNLKKAIVEALGDNTTGIIKQFTEAIKQVTEELSQPDTQVRIKEYADAILSIGKAFKWAADASVGFINFFADMPLDTIGVVSEATRLAEKNLINLNEFYKKSNEERQRMVKESLRLESDQQKSQQENIKYQKELLSSITDTGKETKNAGDAFNSGWSPIVGTTAQITDQMRENEKTIKSITEKLQEQAITAGKTGIEKVRAELEAANATDEEKKAILALAAANEQKENARKNAEKAQRKAEQDAESAIKKAEAAEKARQGRIDNIIQKLKDQIATYKQGKEVSAEVALQHENATPGIIEYAKALGRELDQMKAINKAQKEYDALMAKTAPDQVDLKRNEAIAVLNEQFKDVTKNADEYKKSLKQINDYYDTKELKEYETEVSKLAETIGSLKTSSFGNEMADGINNAVISMRDLNDYLEKNKDTYDDIKKKREEAYAIANEDEREKKIKELDELEGKYTASQLSGYRQLFGTISQLYGENTKEREALHKIEMAFAAAEIAMNLQKTISAAYTAIATQGAGDPYTAFARVAAMTALMAGIVSAAGGSLSSGGSGGGAASAAASTSSSTVLGSTEGSQSISNSLDFMTDIQSKQYNELKDINTGVESLNKNITGLVTSIVRTGGVSAYKGTLGTTNSTGSNAVKYGLSSVANPVLSPLILNDVFQSFKNNIGDTAKNLMSALSPLTLGATNLLSDAISGLVNSLVGSSKKVSLLAEGLKISSGTVGDLLGNIGVSVEKFADIVITKKSGWLSGGGTTKYPKELVEALTPDEESITVLFTNVFKNMGETMVAIAKNLNLGEENIEAIYAYTFDIGKIDLKGLETSEDINAALTEAINKAGDFAAIKFFQELIGKYQQTGEGLLETAIRVVSEKGVVEDILSMTNQAFDNAAIPEIALATTQSIIDLAGGIKQLQESSSTYFNEFFDDGEKQARLYSQLSGAMASINLPMAENRDAFRAMVESLDLNTESGREQYATLLNLSEAADKYYDALESGEKTTKDNSDAITSMVADTQKAIDQMDMSEFDKSIQNIKDNTEKSIKQLTDMGASESDLAVIREYGNKQIKELTDAQNQQIADEKAASEILRASKQLELDILNGVATEQDKVNLQRQQELKTLPESVQGIQQAIWAREDEIAANEKAAKIASEKSALQLRIDELTMSSSDFLAKKRQIELAAMDDTLKPLQERIYHLEDEASAIANAAEVAGKRQSLEIELLNLTGRSAEAVAIQRRIELESLDNSLTSLQERIWALQDEQVINEESAANLEKTNNILKERQDLEIQLLEAQGKTAEALALTRQRELLAIDESNRSLQERIWQIEDESAATSAANQRAEEESSRAKNVIQERYNLETQMLQLMGNTEELRRRELATLDASNRSLQQRIWDLQDEAEQQELINSLRKSVSDKKNDLERQLLELTGTTEEIRQAEIEGLSDLNNGLSTELESMQTTLSNAQSNIAHQQRFLDNAIEQYTDALDIRDDIREQKEAITQQINELTTATGQIPEENRSLVTSLQTQWSLLSQQEQIQNGFVTTWSNAIRTYSENIDNLESSISILPGEIANLQSIIDSVDTDPLVDLQQQIWNLQDAARIATEKKGLEDRLRELTMGEEELLLYNRQKELDAVDESNKSLLQMIFNLEDAAAATQALTESEKELEETRKEIASKRFDLENQLLSLQGKSEQAIARERAKQLESMDESLKPLQRMIWLLEDQAAAAEKIEDKTKKAESAIIEFSIAYEDSANSMITSTDKIKNILEEKERLELRIAELTLSEVEYLALTRQKELLTIDESNKALQERIYQLEDEKKIAELAAEAEAERIEKINEINNKKSDLELKISEMTLSKAEYLAIVRERELAAIDESLRPIQEHIYQLEDEAAALEIATQAEQDRIADIERISEEKANLELRFAELTLTGTEYLALTRQKELLTIDESNRSIQEAIWLKEDEIAANEVIAQQAEEAANLAKEKQSLEIELLREQGFETEATAMQRQIELAAMDESLRSIQERIWALQDEKTEIELLEKAEEDRINTLKDQLKTSEDILRKSIDTQIEYYQNLADKAAEVLEKATSDLEKAYQAEQEKIVAEHESIISSLTASLEEAKDSAAVLEDTFKSLSDARKSMEQASSSISYKEAQKQLFLALEMARKGDIAGTQQLIANLDTVTSPEMEMYKSQEDYKRDFYRTYYALSELESLTGDQLSEQEQIVNTLQAQIDLININHEASIKALEKQYNAVLGVDTSVKTFEQAVIDYQKAQYEADGANALLKQQTEQLNNQLNALLNINNSVLSVEEAIRQYQAIAAQIPATSVSIPGYANGGMAEGTYMVGERGAEILTTPPARITSNSDIKSMLNDEDVKRILAEIKEEISRGNFNIAKNTQETAKTLKKFDYDGMPETRV